MSENHDYSVQLAADTKDAKRAPEIAAWLRLGPLMVDDIVEMRRERMLGNGMTPVVAQMYSTASVMHDLGRLAGLGGPVEYQGGLLWLNETHRAAIDAWVREDADRISLAPADDEDADL
ncbi:hypothetical protein [Microbacterium enclense]|uniref:hypothetical protein n=1 Tax=Microbacterium enclense TaxID=993073 RepID=UPI0034218700